jgi:hypothetical protein
MFRVRHALHPGSSARCDDGQVIEHATSFDFIDDAEGEADVHDDLITRDSVRCVGQAHFLHDPAETDAASAQERIVACGAENLTRNREAHRRFVTGGG